MQLVIELIDSKTHSPQQEIVIEENELGKLANVLGIPHLVTNTTLVLSKSQSVVMEEHFCLVSKMDWCGLITIRPLHWTDLLPYRIHTNRELSLMLAGTKPLAAFSDLYLQIDEEIIPEKYFEPYVGNRFIKRSYIELDTSERVLRVFYSLPAEEWRIDAYIMLIGVASRGGWNESLERFEGYLLGYEDWQCDRFFESRKKWRGSLNKMT